MDENQILELLLARNEQAIGEVDNVYGKRLYNLAYGILKNREDAGECVNDTLWKAWRAIPPARPKYLWAFLSKICRNTAISRLRFENAEKRHGAVYELSEEMEQCIPDRFGEEKIESRALVLAFNQFLDSLSKEKRLIFMRRYWYGESVSEIAKRFEISESKVKASLFRTRNYLKQFLQREGFEE
ncbi:MAG: RNA polymerase sigma factor [Acetatifactor sp.]